MAGIRRRKGETDEDFAVRGAEASLGAPPAPAPEAPKETAPKRAVARSRRKPSKQEVQGGLATTIVLSQSGLLLIAPQWSADALNPQEIGMLSEALADEVMSHAMLLRYWSTVAGAAPHGKLAYVVLMLALPRLARHGVIPAELLPGIVGSVGGTGATEQTVSDQSQYGGKGYGGDAEYEQQGV